MEPTGDSLDKELREVYLKLGRRIRYGTAGFRDLAENIEYISYRCGVFVTVLNQTQPDKSLGVVVSASHNKVQDNGLKITNFHGHMLEMEYEPVLQKFVEEEDINKAIADFKEYLTNKQNKIVYTKKVHICIGGDTRPSTPRLLDLLTKAVETYGGRVINFGEVTTPQLQYYVYHIDNQPAKFNVTATAEQLRQVYWQHFTQYFIDCQKFLGKSGEKLRVLDCANGIGGKSFPHFAKLIEPYLQTRIINNDNPSQLNDHCGADFLKTTKKFPLCYDESLGRYCVSFDGDADRVILYVNREGKLGLIDGDKIAALLTIFYTCLLKRLQDATDKLNNDLSNLEVALDFNWSIGLVQTYYANSAAADYLQKNYGVKPVLAATGVKYLHEKAEHFDVGIYFEANGHGTVIFNDTKVKKIEVLLQHEQLTLEPLKTTPEQYKQAKEYFDLLRFFWNCCKLPNPSVGDAISDFLLIEVALDDRKMCYDTLLDLYHDYESRTSKIKVKNKQVLKVTDVEDKVVEPADLQPAIDEILKKHGGYKAFVRASGTEDVLRLHVEAKDMETVEKIEREIGEVVAASASLN